MRVSVAIELSHSLRCLENGITKLNFDPPFTWARWNSKGTKTKLKGLV